MDTNDDPVSRAERALYDIQELADSTAEHHPYWALLYNCSQISKLVLEKWNDEDKYSDAYYLHGLAVELAEALAQWINHKIKFELHLEKGGLRYSWGFPSCPDVSQHHLVWKLLQPEKSGMTLTESGQIIPEQSTAAMVIHHPNAQYFVI